MASDLTEITPNGRLRLHFHPGQARAWHSRARFVAVIAGTQGGKTSFGPHWLYREIQRCGPGDYIVATPTFALLEKKALPEFLKLFSRWLKLGRYVASPVRKFTFSEDGARRTFGRYDPEKPTVVFFGYAEDPESLESATARAAWLDEPGQKKFKVASWEALLRRLSLAGGIPPHELRHPSMPEMDGTPAGRALLTTTPYDLGWLKQQVHDRYRRVGTDSEQRGDRDYEVVRFDSTENPQFSAEEFDRARRDLPRWKFDLFYRGIFTRPAGLIYDSFLDEYAPRGHKVPRFALPPQWPRYLGLDFGGVNTAGTFYAEDPATVAKDRAGRPLPGTGKLYLYRTYKAGGRTAAQHAAALLRGEPGIPVCVGGSRSEGQWRKEFAAGGLPVREPPIKDVEVGIDRVYAAHAASQILVFEDLSEYLEQKTTYSRVVDERGEPTEKIEDKETFHLLDAERYVLAHLRDTGPKHGFS
jgi:hypothetical protein